ncbi:MAG: LysR family transcriptional regulator [Rhizobiales bacterium]|nr:LysR family transcriptional regulator [Hyphomicrobiales bacterium]
MNLRSLDLNLLVVFDAIFVEKNITRAGLRIGLSQPAVSNALTRLRGHLRDELFLRGSEGLRPTPRAIELSGPIHTMLVDLQNVLDPSAFDPATASRAFTIAAVDYFSVVVAPKLAVHLAKHAPGIDVRIVPTAGRAMELLDQAEIDLAMASFSDPPERFGRATLVMDGYSCMVAAGHSLSEGKLTLARFAGARHLLVTPRGDARGFVDDKLAEKGLTRRVAMTVNHFSAAPGIVEGSDLVLTAPTKIIERYLSERTVMLPAPVEAPAVFRRLDMIWHERLARHPAHQWFRQTLIEVAAEV